MTDKVAPITNRSGYLYRLLCHFLFLFIANRCFCHRSADGCTTAVLSRYSEVSSISKDHPNLCDTKQGSMHSKEGLRTWSQQLLALKVRDCHKLAKVLSYVKQLD